MQRALSLVAIALMAGCLNVEVAPSPESFGLLPGTEADYHATFGYPDVILESTYTFRFDTGRVFDAYGNELEGWIVTVSNQDGFPFPLDAGHDVLYQDEPPRTDVWTFDACGEPLTRRGETYTTWHPDLMHNAPPFIAATQMPAVHDLTFGFAQETWQIDNRVQPPATISEGAPGGFAVVHERIAVRAGTGTPPVCAPGVANAPGLVDIGGDWADYLPPLEPPLAEAIAAARDAPLDATAQAYFQAHPDARVQRMWHDPDGGALTPPAADQDPGAWALLWADDSAEVLQATCTREAGSPAASGMIVCTFREETWDGPGAPEGPGRMADPAVIVPAAFGVLGVEQCDLVWDWVGNSLVDWVLHACSPPLAGGLWVRGYQGQLQVDAGTGRLLYLFQ